MHSMIANGVALWGILLGLWFALAAASPAGLDAGGWLSGAGASGVVILVSARLGLLGGAPWPDRAAGAAALLLRRVRMGLEGVGLALRALVGDSRAMQPALVRYTMAQANPARGIFVLGVSLLPGLVSVNLDARGLFLHVLHEDDADDEDLQALEGGAFDARAK